MAIYLVNYDSLSKLQVCSGHIELVVRDPRLMVVGLLIAADCIFVVALLEECVPLLAIINRLVVKAT